MKTRLLVLALLAGALWALERGLARAQPVRAEREAMQRLIPPALVRERPIAGLSIESAGKRHLYALRGGLWRCESAFGALALANGVEDLMRDLAEAIGPPRSADPARQRDYGFDGPRTVRIGLHGPRLAEDPAQDVVATVEIGLALPGPGKGRCFARLAGTPEILEIQRNPRAIVEREQDGLLPALLDRRVLAGEFPPPGEGVARAFVDFEDGRSLELRFPPEPKDWVAIAEGARTPCLPFRVAGWQAFLFRVGYVGLADPAQAHGLGLDPPRARLSLFLTGGSRVELAIGRAGASGRVFVRNEKTGSLCQIEPEHAALFAPTVAMMSAPGPNPWEAWLRR